MTNNGFDCDVTDNDEIIAGITQSFGCIRLLNIFFTDRRLFFPAFLIWIQDCVILESILIELILPGTGYFEF